LATGESLFSSRVALNLKAPDDQQKYSQANGMVRKCVDLIRFRPKIAENAFQTISQPEADGQRSVELN
jgi:hypothetical protein